MDEGYHFVCPPVHSFHSLSSPDYSLRLTPMQRSFIAPEHGAELEAAFEVRRQGVLAHSPNVSVFVHIEGMFCLCLTSLLNLSQIFLQKCVHVAKGLKKPREDVSRASANNILSSFLSRCKFISFTLLCYASYGKECSTLQFTKSCSFSAIE